MYKKDVISFFGTQQEAAEALGVTQAAVAQWGDVIPERHALRLDRLTRGRLAYAEYLYRPVNGEVANERA